MYNTRSMGAYTAFKKTVWDHYSKHKRPMPWRDDLSPYSVFLSEVMLQQTQVSRVLLKYPSFMSIFPTFSSLAEADTQTLLTAWQGMGYNRRALYLRDAARIIMETYGGTLPKEVSLLDGLPGIGYATACSIAAFVYNTPVSFIETNIRRVYIHHFFKTKAQVDDKDILQLVNETVSKKKAREWYWALMDYGAYLAKREDNPNRKSRHYVKQKKFQGSVREVRGGILKLLLQNKQSLQQLKKLYPDERLFTALVQLEKEGFITKEGTDYSITMKH